MFRYKGYQLGGQRSVRDTHDVSTRAAQPVRAAMRPIKRKVLIGSDVTLLWQQYLSLVLFLFKHLPVTCDG